MDTLARDPLYFAQLTGSVCRQQNAQQRGDCFVEEVANIILGLLGTDFPLQWERLSMHKSPESCQGSTPMYDTLSSLLPMSSQGAFFWRKLGKPFSTMLATAGFSLELQCRFLTFVYARVLGMMGPYKGKGEPSIMTFDGSPAELSWVIPKSDHFRESADRQVRFAIEPLDPRTGELLCGDDVVNYLVSPSGSLGIVDCPTNGMAWRTTLERFLFREASGHKIPKGSKFFIGFDFSSTGWISLKPYYTPSPRMALSARSSNWRDTTLRLWDSDWTKLRPLIAQLNPSLSTPLETLISFINDLDEPLRPRIQILSVDCSSSSANRLKIYCRPREGSSWADACRTFTLGGKLSSPSMTDALSHLEILWNNLFPSCRSSSGRHLVLPERAKIRDAGRLGKRNMEHPMGGLLFYFSLQTGVDIPLPKIYLPVSRYCQHDLQICNAVEQVYKEGGRRPDSKAFHKGWVAREVSNAFNHRELKTHTGIHTYITLAYKGKGWDLTSYFSPEVWS